jgi:penicillin-binding protein 2
MLARFSRLVPLDSGDVDDVVARYREAKYQPAQVLGNASQVEVSKLEEHRAELPGLVVQSEPRRIYPRGRAVAHLVGYVGEVSEKDLSSDRFPGAALGVLVGRAGLELTYDDSLRGVPGLRYIEVDARGRLVREEGAAPPLLPTPGAPIHTTIDLPLQLFIDSIWPAGVRGAMVAMTPAGEIRAFYSAPAYDPNEFIGGISSAGWRALNEDPALPLLDRAVQVRYPPASPFKLAMAAMALRRGLIDLHTRMPDPCRGYYQYGNRAFKCWKKTGHGSLDLEGAIAQSCDVYFYQLGLRLGLNAILQDGVLLGFKEKSGIDLPNEVTPIFPASTAYYDKVYGPRNWSSAVILNLAIGQGENTQTLINMVRFYAGLSSGGKAPVPYVVRPSGANAHDLGLSTAQLESMRTALIAVLEKGGTASASSSKDLAVAGKTGTAQNPHGKDHGWFIGFAPADKPEIIIGGVMEFAVHGTVVAPYVVRAIRRYLLGPADSGKTSIKLLVPDDVPASAGETAPDSTVPDTAAVDIPDTAQ